MHIYCIFTYIQIYTNRHTVFSLAAEFEKQNPRTTTNRSEHNWPPVAPQLQLPGPGQQTNVLLLN